MNDSNKTFDFWCIVELFGHTKVAGKCSEQEIAGTNFLRVDIPENDTQPGFTQFYGSGAIYAIHPVTEEVAIQTANALKNKPVDSWDLNQAIRKHNSLLAEKVASSEGEGEDDDLAF